ncbi:hypothetical protein SMICM304S_03364 [Streptomyces microflavus]
MPWIASSADPVSAVRSHSPWTSHKAFAARGSQATASHAPALPSVVTAWATRTPVATRPKPQPTAVTGVE